MIKVSGGGSLVSYGMDVRSTGIGARPLTGLVWWSHGDEVFVKIFARVATCLLP